MAYTNPEAGGVYCLPDENAPEQDVLAYKQRFFNWRSTYRSRHMERQAMGLLYTLGRQWIELDTEVLIDGIRGYVFKDIVSGDVPIEIPKPVLNYVASSVEVELAALGKRQLTPNVLTTSRDPRIQAAARVAKEILEHRMKKLNWPSIRELATYLTVVTGTAAIKSYWDAKHSDLTLVGSPDAAWCPQCEMPLASRSVPLSVVSGRDYDLSTARSIAPEEPGAPEEVELTSCPQCGVGSPLAPFDVGASSAESTDPFGRPMGMLVPKGNTMLEVVSPFELFPDNSGVETTPEDCKVWGQATVRSLDWIGERYPERWAEIERESPTELMQYHPLLGEWSVLGRYHATLDSGIYDDHARVYEIHAERSYRFPEGRSVVVVGDKILENGPLYKTITTDAGILTVPRVQYAGARFKVRFGEFWGQSLVDDLISPQNLINARESQITNTFERMGEPNLLASENMSLEGPEWVARYGGKVLRYQTDPLAPNAAPQWLTGQAMPGEVYREKELLIQDMQRIAGPQEIEIGEAPKNISTTSGLQLLGEKAEQRRAPRERALISMYEKTWEHQLRLIWALRTESDEYEKEAEDGTWETAQYDRTALKGQTQVRIEKQAYIDKSLYQAEAAREAMADGLYGGQGPAAMMSQSAKKRLLELRNLPTDVNEGLNRQVDLGKQQYVDYVEKGEIPFIDMTLDNFEIRFEVIGDQLISDEGKRFEASVGWPKVLKLIAGWEDELARAEMLDQMAVDFYGGRVPPEQGAEMYAQATSVFEQESAAQEKIEPEMAQAAAEGGIAAPALPPPVPPPPPIFLPAAKEDRIYALWIKLIGQNSQGVPPIPEDTLDPAAALASLDNHLKFRAVVDAYRLLAQEKMMKDLMGAMGPAPPTGGEDGGGGSAGPGGTPGGLPAPPNPPNLPQGAGNRKMNLNAKPGKV